MLLTLGIVGGFLALVPLFFDFTSLRFSRRVAQSAADAAAHAAAVEYAQWAGDVPLDGSYHPDRFSGKFIGPCKENPFLEEAATLYWNTVVVPTVGFDHAEPRATSYAAKYQSKILDYQEFPHPAFGVSQPIAPGIAIHPIRVYVKTERQAELVYRGLFSTEYFAPAEATAEVYPEWPHPELKICGASPDGKVIYMQWILHFQWKVRLV